MLGCLNQNLGKIWTNPNIGLKILTQLQRSLSTLFLLIAFLTQHLVLSMYTLKKCWVVLTQFWVKYGQTRNVGLKM